MDSNMLRATTTERKRIRSIVYSGGAEIRIADNDDGSWHADIYGVLIEAESPAALLRELALVLEEA
jgi:hypothetical protein